MVLSSGLWIFLLVFIETSVTSAANYPQSYYRRICYRPHCFHGYQGYNLGYMAAGKWWFYSQNADEVVVAVFVCACLQPDCGSARPVNQSCWYVSALSGIADNFVSDQNRGGLLLSTEISAHENMKHESWETLCNANTSTARYQIHSLDRLCQYYYDRIFSFFFFPFLAWL